ncbi:MAG: tRNA (adenosine(37)-N6)-threonylcarbamoyltransferase complex transferase subunit TsaD [Dehalococcoidia bacterium]|nr:tRNA (adenosine(37)-N6)-threonylcarbamoyltransferase complex transferase subunit TsaD [Dehalococcoidia bacterium]
MLILGIETSCDETAAAVVENGRRILSNTVASQVEMHARYGGVVPEVASRQHILQILPVVSQALKQAEVTLDQLHAVAVTHGPGLAGALLVGVNLAKALAFAKGIPLYGINHLEGHIYAAWLQGDDPESSPGFPLLCLVASGGHTDLVLMERHGAYSLLGRTRDDAAGESFDKAARTLGLGYPGGPAIQRAAQGVTPGERLPRAWMAGSLDFSFSGLKTALLHKAQSHGLTPRSAGEAMGAGDVASREPLVKDLAAAFQESVVDVLVSKTLDAARRTGANGIILGGGVTANTLLRERMRASSGGLPVMIPPPALCVDNAAMIAACAYFHSRHHPVAGWDLDIMPSLGLG